MVELGRKTRMSNTAVSERVRRLEEAGIITGYGARVDHARLGYTVSAFARLKYPTRNRAKLDRTIAETPEILEAHHVTGDDCFILRIVATSMTDLEQIVGRIGALGETTTSIVYSSPLPTRAITPPRQQHQMT